jgi:cob(I)alamin adenosyltransferase
MLLIYTGEGKGKTSAAVGQAVRAIGRGLNVAFAQFLKSSVRAGEQEILRSLLSDRFYIGGLGFYRDTAEKDKHAAAAGAVLAWALELAPKLDMLVLDEALYALNRDLLRAGDLCGLIRLCRFHDTHLVLSGRGLPEWLKLEADLVTEMIAVKHPYGSGVQAQSGIEF